MRNYKQCARKQNIEIDVAEILISNSGPIGDKNAHWISLVLPRGALRLCDTRAPLSSLKRGRNCHA